MRPDRAVNRRAAVAVALLLAAAMSCSDGDETITAGQFVTKPVAGLSVGGEVGGVEVLLAARPPSEMVVSWSHIECEDGGDAGESAHPELVAFDVPATVDDDGNFEGERVVVEYGLDGDDSIYTINVEGKLSAEGSSEGVLSFHDRFINGQFEDKGGDSCIGEVEWTTEPAEDRDLGATLFAFQAVTEYDVDTVEAFIDDGLDPAVQHPTVDQTLTEAISEDCVPSDLGWALQPDGGEGDDVRFPSEEEARSAIDALVALGAPEAGC